MDLALYKLGKVALSFDLCFRYLTGSKKMVLSFKKLPFIPFEFLTVASLSAYKYV